MKKRAFVLLTVLGLTACQSPQSSNPAPMTLPSIPTEASTLVPASAIDNALDIAMDKEKEGQEGVKDSEVADSFSQLRVQADTTELNPFELDLLKEKRFQLSLYLKPLQDLKPDETAAHWVKNVTLDELPQVFVDLPLHRQFFIRVDIPYEYHPQNCEGNASLPGFEANYTNTLKEPGLTQVDLKFKAIQAPQDSDLVRLFCPVSIEGQVVDQSGLPVSEARIQLLVAGKPLDLERNKDSFDGVFEVITDVNGKYVINTVNYDEYEVVVKKEGYETVTQNVTLFNGRKNIYQHTTNFGVENSETALKKISE